MNKRVFWVPIILLVLCLFPVFIREVHAEDLEAMDHSITEETSEMQDEADEEIQEGWVTEKEDLYYYIDGSRQTGWLQLEGQWYYFADDGRAFRNRWLLWKNKWYYLKNNGCMAENEAIQSGNEYYVLGAGGVMAKSGWKYTGGTWYYLTAGGAAHRNSWLLDRENWYYLGADGHMFENAWVRSGGSWYYLRSGGSMARNQWILDNGIWYHIKPDGRMTANAWVKTGGDWYYLLSSGAMAKSQWLQQRGSWYYLKESGVMAAGGWLKEDNSWYYMQGSGAAMMSRWLTSGGEQYFLKGDCRMAANGWHRIGGYWYYFKSSGALEKSKWLWDNGHWYYLKSDGRMAASEWIQDGGQWYYVDSSGKYLSDDSRMTYNNASVEGKTVKSLLQNALVPCGRTLYVWGGGWGGSDSQKIGYLRNWWAFFRENGKSSYNHNNYRYRSGSGLDCSGYVAWVAYNTMYSKNGQRDILANSGGADGLAKRFSEYGWTTLMKPPKSYEDLCAGDVCSMDGHVYLCVGTCSDGSAVIIHSSPTNTGGGGVMLAGTPDRSGKYNSESVQLAKKYMKTYFAAWPWEAGSVGSIYLTRLHTVGRWKNDPDGLQEMSAEEILKILFGE